MQSPQTSRFVPILMAVIMTLPLIAISVGAQTPAPVSNNMQLAIEQRYDFQAPFGTWSIHDEVTSFTIHSDTAINTGGAAVPGGATYWYDTQRPAGNTKEVVIGGDGLAGGNCRGGQGTDERLFVSGAGFPQPNGVKVETKVREVFGNVWVAGPVGVQTPLYMTVMDYDTSRAPNCDPAAGPLNPRPIATVGLQQSGNTGAAIGTAPVAIPLSGSVKISDGGYEVVAGLDGYTVKENHFLDVVFSANSPLSGPIGVGTVQTEAVRMLFDSNTYPSSWGVISDSVRVNMWTEDKFGVVEDSFPGGARASTEERRIVLQSIVGNSWGLQNCAAQQDVTGAHNPNTANNLCPSDNLNEDGVRIRLRDITPNHNPQDDPNWNRQWQYNQYVPIDQTMGFSSDPGRSDFYVRCCKSATVASEPIIYNPQGLLTSNGVVGFEYEFVYGEDFPPGKYQIEFHDSTKGWKEYYNINIGNTGWDFQFAPNEFEVTQDGTEAKHLVFLAEPTEYVVRIVNNGAAPDTYGISIPTPGNGWEARVEPNTATVQPGAHHDFVIRVDPPANGRAGDVKFITASAVSVNDNSIKTLRMRTTLTGETILGVDLENTVGEIATRPGRIENLPIPMRNTGTVQGDFVVTTGGIPLGWSVTVQPNFANLLAATHEDLLIQVFAPEEAVPPLEPATECGNSNAEDNHPGCPWTLLVTAIHAADNTVRDTIEIPVKVFLVDDIDAKPLRNLIVMHDVAADNPDDFCIGLCFNVDADQDVTFDDKAVFRVQMDNLGDRFDTIGIFGSWVPPRTYAHPYPVAHPDDNDIMDQDDCDYQSGSTLNRIDGVPDGWRIRILDGAGIDEFIDPEGRLEGYVTVAPTTPQHGVAARINTANDGFSGEYHLGDLTLPPRTSQDVYLEMSWIVPSERVDGTCHDPYESPSEVDTFRSAQPDPEARFRMTVRSDNDPAIRDVEVLTTRLRPIVDPALNSAPAPVNEQQEVPTAIHDVMLEPILDEVLQKDAPVFDPDNPTRFVGATYWIRATNVGDEHGDLVLRVDRGTEGWTHRFLPAFVVPSGVTILPTNADPPRPTRECTDPAISEGDLEIVCRNIGVYDEVWVRVWALPPTDGEIGDLDKMAVTASMRGNSGIVFSDTIEMLTRIRGEYFFEVKDLAGERIAHPGQTIAFPFTIHNLGSETDEYQLNILEAEPSWLAQFGSSPVVSVPAGHRWHGFLSATVPIDWEFGNAQLKIEEHFRIQVKSMNSPVGSQQIEILDFFADVQDKPDYVTVSEAVTVRSNDNATFNVTAQANDAGMSFMRMEIDRETLPFGYSYVCTPGSQVVDSNNPTPRCEQDAPHKDNRLFTSGQIVLANGETETHPAIAKGDFTLVAPPDQLGTSRIISRIKMLADNDTEDQLSWHDAVTNLATRYGVSIEVVQQLNDRVTVGPDGAQLIMQPGSTQKNVFNVRVTNTGLMTQTVALGNSPLPAGWQIAPGSSGQLMHQERLEPGQSKIVPLTISAPLSFKSGDVATILIFAEILDDPDKKAQTTIKVVVGTYDFEIYPLANELNADPADVRYAAPTDTVTFYSVLESKADVPDRVKIMPLMPAPYDSIFKVNFVRGCDSPTPQSVAAGETACFVDLQVKEQRVIEWTVEVPKGTTAFMRVPITMSAVSQISQLQAQDEHVFFVQMLDFVAQDIDADSLGEMAIDVDRDPSNGYESFRDIPEAGIQAKSIDLLGFLAFDLNKTLADGGFTPDDDRTFYYEEITDEGLYLDINSRLRAFVDINGDGRADHLLDINRDGLPDIYWDPWNRYFADITVKTDVTRDGVREYFFDVNRNCQLDVYYNLAQGVVKRLVQVHANDDSWLDYLVDNNENGVFDEGETVLISTNIYDPNDPASCNPRLGFQGIGQIVSSVDMNGDGDFDTVLDVDADGDPDQFIPFGQRNPIAITLEDVTGDGVLDWTYASSGTGPADSYYDPTTGKSGFIDRQSEFARDLAEYWWIGVLFAFVAMLFVVLVAVTRR